jgi:hypothetical protein
VLVYGATKPNEHEKERNTAGITISIPVAPNPESAQGFSFVLQATAQRVDNLVQHLNHDEKNHPNSCSCRRTHPIRWERESADF